MYQLGQQAAQANSLSNYQNMANAAPPPQPLTLNSALSRSEGLNERIGQAVNRVSQIASVLGALHPTEGNPKPGQIPAGVVHRLNDAADCGHDRMTELENLLSGIERALG